MKHTAILYGGNFPDDQWSTGGYTLNLLNLHQKYAIHVISTEMFGTQTQVSRRKANNIKTNFNFPKTPAGKYLIVKLC